APCSANPLDVLEQSQFDQVGVYRHLGLRRLVLHALAYALVRFTVLGEMEVPDAALLRDVYRRIELANLVHPCAGIEADQGEPAFPRCRWVGSKGSELRSLEQPA